MSPAAIVSTRLFCRTSFAGRAINYFPESVARIPSPVIILTQHRAPGFVCYDYQHSEARSGPNSINIVRSQVFNDFPNYLP